MLNHGRSDAARISRFDSRANDDEKSASLRRTRSVAYLSGTCGFWRLMSSPAQSFALWLTSRSTGYGRWRLQPLL